MSSPQQVIADASELRKENAGIVIPQHVDEWDEYFSHLARVVSTKSKDHDCPVGAVIVSPDRVILSTGFNGLPRKVYDDPTLIDDKDEKLKVILHAEQNAILNAARIGVSVEGAHIYVAKFPCLACCNSIIQVGITRVYTLDDRYWKNDPFDPEKDGHWRKKSVIRQAHLIVDAPNHIDYMTKKPAGSVKSSGSDLGVSAKP